MDTGALQLGLELEDLIHLDFKQMCKAATKEMEVLRKCVTVLVAHAHNGCFRTKYGRMWIRERRHNLILDWIGEWRRKQPLIKWDRGRNSMRRLPKLDLKECDGCSMPISSSSS
jgi:hypothetical protein